MLVYYFVSANIIIQVTRKRNYFFSRSSVFYFYFSFLSFFCTYFLSFRIVFTILFSLSVLLAFTATLLIWVLNKGDVRWCYVHHNTWTEVYFVICHFHRLHFSCHAPHCTFILSILDSGLFSSFSLSSFSRK